MTALSFALFIPERGLLEFGPDDFAGAERDAQQRYFFLLAMELLLREQWGHHTAQGGGVPPACPRAAEETDAPEDAAGGRVFFGSGASGRLRDFIYRLLSHSRCSVECYPLALILFDRFFEALKRMSDVMQRDVSMERKSYIFAVLLMISAKFRDDRVRSNRYFSQLVGLPLAKWNALERFVIRVLGFDVHVSLGMYTLYEKLVLQEMARQEEKTRTVGLRHYNRRFTPARCESPCGGCKEGADQTETAAKDTDSFVSCDVTASLRSPSSCSFMVSSDSLPTI